ncbi:SWR1-complex 5 [Hyphodiscus hymeniophilus]|uniref:SWR1-complex protein 5 n=1 Tax=Hyphodiscus hymeniophilus TaxID=353542 RepID=A0A9P6VQI4_9HELO|nr:SWR1-complex 5 [Hyphodiscus hymeniophilus]
MPPELIPDDEDYASDEDSDFAPDTAPVVASDASSDEGSETEDNANGTFTQTFAKASTKSSSKLTPKASAKRKRGQDEEAEDAGFDNSGDEAIIERGLKRQKKRKGGRKGKDMDEDGEDEGGEGGLVKTRSMRAQEKEEKKKPLADTAAATVDVDALWANMISGKSIVPEPTIESAIETRSSLSPNLSPNTNRNLQNGREHGRSSSTLGDDPESMVMIKRTYNFAGKIHTEQKLVPRNSAEAKLFLASQTQPTPATAPEPAADPLSPSAKPKRPLKRARKSVFEPVTELPIRTDLHFGPRKESEVALVDIGKGAKKMNTVDKSAMDWAQFVDKEGIADELDAAGKSKGAYKSRQEFLARVEDKRVEDERRARGLPV